MGLISRFWAAIGFGLTLFGIFWLPVDVSEWQTAAEPWRRLFTVVDQNIALWVFSISSFIYIIQIEVRPYIISIFDNRKKHSLTLITDKELSISKTQFVLLGDLKKFVYRYEYNLIIRNDSRNTIKSVTLEGDYMGQVCTIATSGGDKSVDLRPGTAVAWRVAHYYSNYNATTISLPETEYIDEKLFDILSMRIGLNSLWINREKEKPVLVMVSAKWENAPTLEYMISADDVPPVGVVISVKNDGDGLPRVAVEHIGGFGEYDKKMKNERSKA